MHICVLQHGCVLPCAALPQDIKRKEVTNPPKVYEYNDTSVEPNYVKSTAAADVRRSKLSPDKLATVQAEAMKSLTWHSLSGEEVAAKIAESEARRRAQAVKMNKDQYDLEKK